ncbi:MAG TPA: YihY/virulence factor BrkB family protein [Spongiibacteraceae bacterium]|nr:YihY/virulence factor BrkB family protein [Spongiibacteraceae bacterium]
MKLSLNETAGLVAHSISSWLDDRASTMGAALAFYTAFSLSPLLLVIIAAAGLIVDADITQQAILWQFEGLLGADGAHFVQTLLQSAQRKDSGILSIAISAITLFIGATTVFSELEHNLNKIWKVDLKPNSSAFHFVRTRILSFGLVLALGFLLIVSLSISTAINAMSTLLGNWYKVTAYVLDGLNFVVSFAAITVLFALIYKLLPATKIALSDVWFGAIITALLFSIGKYLIGLYLGRSAISSSFGAAGTFIVLMLWIYYSAQIFLLGAEFTYLYATRFGSLKKKHR